MCSSWLPAETQMPKKTSKQRGGFEVCGEELDEKWQTREVSDNPDVSQTRIPHVSLTL